MVIYINNSIQKKKKNSSLLNEKECEKNIEKKEKKNPIF